MRSGAPTTRVPSSGKVTALHFRWEEKEIFPVGVWGMPRLGKQARMAWKVALLSSMWVRKAPIQSARGMGRSFVSCTVRSTRIFPWVRVPVLSRHSTSTWARLSRENRFCTSTRDFASFATPTARLTVISSTSPLGSIPNKPAAVVVTALNSGVPRRTYAWKNRSRPRGGIKKPVNRVT